MSLFVKHLPDLVILSGQQASNALEAKLCYSDCELITIYSPAAGTSGIIQVSPDGLTWYKLVEGPSNTDVPMPIAGDARVYAIIPATGFFRLFNTIAPGANRTYKCDASWRAS